MTLKSNFGALRHILIGLFFAAPATLRASGLWCRVLVWWGRGTNSIERFDARREWRASIWRYYCNCAAALCRRIQLLSSLTSWCFYRPRNGNRFTSLTLSSLRLSSLHNPWRFGLKLRNDWRETQPKLVEENYYFVAIINAVFIGTLIHGTQNHIVTTIHLPSAMLTILTIISSKMGTLGLHSF